MMLLRRSDPGNHLLDCPDTVVIESVPATRTPSGDGTAVITAVFAVQCGHGSDAVKLIGEWHVGPNPS